MLLMQVALFNLGWATYFDCKAIIWVWPHKTTSAAAQAVCLALSFFLGLLSQFFPLLFQQCGTLHYIQFYVSFSPPLFAGSFTGPLRTQWCHTPRTRRFHINYPLDLWWEHAWDCWEIHVNKFLTTRLLLFNKYECIYGTMYKYIHTYIHTHCLRWTR